jgi:hypothetical protein
MGGGPSIPAPPPPPDPAAVAQANAEAYKKNIETYIEKAPEMAAWRTNFAFSICHSNAR